MTVKGTVTSVRDFGAFIDIDGAEGLVPISEIGWGRVENINEYISVGQQVEVEVMRLDWEKDRLSFSLKAKQPDPWEGVVMKYSEGSIHQGKVARLAKFGAFITLEPGIDGLIHISRLGGGKKINSSGDVLTAGQEIKVKIEKIELEMKRISLILDSDEVQGEEAASDNEYRKHVLEAKDNKTESFGTFGDIFKAKLDKMKK
jgi:small subunit ribosomal protein S1